MLQSKLFLSGLALALAGGAFAQSDDCSAATVIGTTGTFAFDTSLNTTSAFDGTGLCAGGDNITFDTFYQWTAPAAGDYSFDTETSSFDTQLSVHTGIGCAATCLAHDDDAGTGLLSMIVINGVSMGDTFLIQVGGWGAAGLGLGNLNINMFVDPCDPNNDDALEDNDDCATALAMTDGTITDLFASDTDNDFYAFCVADGATVDADILFLQAQGDMDIFLRAASSLGCGGEHAGVDLLAEGWSVTDNENISWTNTTGADLDVVLQVDIYGAGCNTYDLILAGTGCGPGGSTGTPFCDPANLNSTGVSAILAGSTTLAGSGLHLEMTQGPVGQLAYMLAGNEATAGIPVSNGQFCLVGTPTAQFFRYNVAGTDMNSIGGFDGTGTWINVSSTSTTGFGFDVPSTIPATVPIVILAGDTWHFQGWYRDTAAAAGSSNFTNGLSVTF